MFNKFLDFFFWYKHWAIRNTIHLIYTSSLTRNINNLLHQKVSTNTLRLDSDILAHNVMRGTITFGFPKCLFRLNLWNLSRLNEHNLCSLNCCNVVSGYGLCYWGTFHNMFCFQFLFRKLHSKQSINFSPRVQTQ